MNDSELSARVLARTGLTLDQLLLRVRGQGDQVNARLDALPGHEAFELGYRCGMSLEGGHWRGVAESQREAIDRVGTLVMREDGTLAIDLASQEGDP